MLQILKLDFKSKLLPRKFSSHVESLCEVYPWAENHGHTTEAFVVVLTAITPAVRGALSRIWGVPLASGRVKSIYKYCAKV